MKCRYFCRLPLDISPVYLTRGISFCSGGCFWQDDLFVDFIFIETLLFVKYFSYIREDILRICEKEESMHKHLSVTSND